jgi:hypothetical protein
MDCKMGDWGIWGGKWCELEEIRHHLPRRGAGRGKSPRRWESTMPGRQWCWRRRLHFGARAPVVLSQRDDAAVCRRAGVFWKITTT